jgi:toxin-antitoxin system PIN domain toxin
LKIFDANILIYAHRAEAPYHARCHQLLFQAAASGTLSTCDMVLCAFVRVVSNPRIFKKPSPLKDALEIAERLRNGPGQHFVTPGPGHWNIFRELALQAEARGNLLSDAYLAALAIEHGLELVSADRDFARFKGLKWRHIQDADSE